MAANNEPPPEGGSERVGEHIRIYKRGSTWHCTFQYQKRQHRESLGTSSKKEARLRAARIDVRLTAGEWEPAVEAVGVREAVEAYLAVLMTEGRAPKTLTKYTGVLGRITRLAESRRVRDVSGLDLAFLDAYRKLRADGGAAPKTRYTECVILRQLVRFALSRNMLASDPMRGARMPKPRPTRQPCWTADEVAKILAATPEAVRPALTLLAETGMRFGELAWLTWDDIDWGANALRVRPKDGWRPKTGDQRVIPLSRAAREVLAGLPRGHKWVVTMPPVRRNPERGRQWTQRRLLAELKRTLERVGLAGKLHTFRHFFIRNALLNNVPVSVVRQWAGHVDRQVIDLYTHVHDAASQAAMRKLSEARGTDDSSSET